MNTSSGHLLLCRWFVANSDRKYKIVLYKQVFNPSIMHSVDGECTSLLSSTGVEWKRGSLNMVFCKINVSQRKNIKMVAHSCGCIDAFKVGGLTGRFFIFQSMCL